MSRTHWTAAAIALCFVWSAGAANMPAEWGSNVNGFQDDFSNGFDASVWKWQSNVSTGPAPCTVSNGVLVFGAVGGDPNHLLYVPSDVDYSKDSQEVLMRIRVTDMLPGGNSDMPRCGAAVGINLSDSKGYNLHFRVKDGLDKPYFEMLDDGAAWGTSYRQLPWQTGEWYWLRLTYDNTGVYGKAWQADGVTAEPDEWIAWGRGNDRTGWAGIAATSNEGRAEFEVDYFLVKAASLPEITVGGTLTPGVPEPATLTLLALGGLAMLRRRFR